MRGALQWSEGGWRFLMSEIVVLGGLALPYERFRLRLGRLSIAQHQRRMQHTTHKSGHLDHCLFVLPSQRTGGEEERTFINTTIAFVSLEWRVQGFLAHKK